MNTSDDLHPGRPAKPTTAEAHPELSEVSRRSARNAKIGALIVLGLLIWWPLLLLAIAFAVPTIAVAAVLGAVVAAIAEPIRLLVRRARAHRRKRHSFQLLKRLRP